MERQAAGRAPAAKIEAGRCRSPRVRCIVLLGALLLPALSGCLGQAPGPPGPLPGAPPGLAPVPLPGCRGSLHVWLVPLAGLARDLPPEFPPQEYLEQGVPTGMGRVGLYVIGCAAARPAAQPAGQAGPAPLVALLAARVEPRDPGLASGNATPLYVFQAYAGGAALGLLGAGGLPVLPAEAQDSLGELPAAGLPGYDLTLRAADGSSVRTHIQGAQREEYDRLFRGFSRRDDGALAVLDLNMTSTLWEGTGTVETSPGSAPAQRVPAPYQANTDYHILLDVRGDLRALLDLDAGRAGSAAAPSSAAPPTSTATTPATLYASAMHAPRLAAGHPQGQASL